ncbi:hypothetical protein ATCC90586_010373 [Pythium insidiosum]|nr:hypothetical protein ATCC90586_010373 [Pythium insidiosum]
MSLQGAATTPRSLGFDARKLGFNEYDPEKDGIVDTWLAGVDNAVRADEVLVGGKWPSDALYYVVGSKLRGSAATFFASMETIAAPADRNYDALTIRPRQQCGTKLTEAAAVNRLMQRKKQPTESYQEYATALRQAVEGVPVGEQFFIEAFQDGLGDFTGSLVRNRAPATTVYNQVVELDALLVKGCDEENLLGKDFLVKKRAKIDFETNEASYFEGENEVILPFTVGAAVGPAAIRLVHGQKIATQTHVTLRVPVAAPEGTAGVFEPAPQQREWLMVPRAVTVVRQGHVTVPVLSVQGKTTKLPAREKVGSWVPLSKDVELLEECGDLSRDKVERWITRLHAGKRPPLPNEKDLQLSHLSDKDAELVKCVLRAFPGVASEATVCPPLTKTGVEHYIPSGTAAPILHRAWRKSVAESAIIDEHAQKMLREGVIEMGNGSWGFPVVLVRKKDGAVRFCVDYRGLNQVTVKDVYPLPRIDETLESLGGASLFTTLDLLAGYWQIGVAEQDRDKTAFVTRQGLLQRLVDAVVEFAAPTDAAAVKRFVHLAGYYRRFVENFGQKMAPLTQLLRKERAWEWGDEQQLAFEGIKRELSQKPLLGYPRFELPFVLATDASLVGLGAVLQQDQGQGLQPLGYASKVNSPTQAKYPITELECLAVVWAIEHFRPFLYGRKFTVVTDHSALKWLMSAKDLKNRLQRWALSLQEYEFEVVYRCGRDNVVLDALSRAPVHMVTAEPRGDAPTNGDGHGGGTRQLDEETIMLRQQDSEMCRVAKERGQIANLRAEKRNGKLMVRTVLGWRTLLPPSLWGPALRECHGSIWAGHLRGPQTLARVQRAFWWPRIHQVTLDWVASCRDCGSRKVRPAKIVQPLRSLQVGEVCDCWALDFAGPLPITAGVNRYVLAVVEYATKWEVAIPAPTREATTVARVLLEKVVFQFGPFRERLTDGAAELQSETVRQLVVMLQAKQTTPVAYRPNLMGLVERYNRIWKDMVSIYVDEHRDDWDEWLPALAYAYNSAKHTATGYAPYLLMYGREPRLPRDLLLWERLEEGLELSAWYRK